MHKIITTHVVILIWSITIAFGIFLGFKLVNDGDMILTSAGKDASLIVGRDIRSGNITFDYVNGTGYLEIIHGDNVSCYSNLGPENILLDHMEFTMSNDDEIRVSKELVLRITSKNIEK